jgi:hypothetical protein
MDMNVLFYRFILCLFILLVLYGAGMFLVLIFDSEAVGIRMISAFGSMFAGVLGFGSGYLLGSKYPTGKDGQ